MTPLTFLETTCRGGARGGVVVTALHYKLAGRSSISDGVIGIFQ